MINEAKTNSAVLTSLASVKSTIVDSLKRS